MSRHQESNIQIACIQWFRLQYPKYLCFSVPNGGIRTAKNARILKAEGLLAGVSDLIVVIDNHVIFIEIKTDTGKQQPTQKEFQKKVEDLGFTYCICRNIDEFMNFITNSIKSKNSETLMPELQEMEKFLQEFEKVTEELKKTFDKIKQK